MLDKKLVEMVKGLPDEAKKEMLSVLNENEEVAKSNDKVDEKVKEPSKQEKDEPVSNKSKEEGKQENQDGKLPKAENEQTIPKGESEILKYLQQMQEQWNKKFDELADENKAKSEKLKATEEENRALKNQKQRGFEPKVNPDMNDENKRVAEKAKSFTRNKW